MAKNEDKKGDDKSTEQQPRPEDLHPTTAGQGVAPQDAKGQSTGFETSTSTGKP